MKFLADENFPPTLISALQKKRHNIKRIQRGIKLSDLYVAEVAKKESRIVMTFDKTFLLEEQISMEINVMILDFPDLKPIEILPYLDVIIQTIKDLKRKKRKFFAIYSEKGAELR